MQAIYDIPAPAKLNLFLHITGRRADGYHLIQSVFALIDWVDTLHLEVRRDGHVTREDLTNPLPDDDLCTRAARALQLAADCQTGVHIGISKSIPAQAGMGGGSSDAASVLLGLNRLWKLNLPLHRLMQIGLSLGADVPFFLAGHNAWVEGIGEKISPVDIPPARLLVVKPEQGLDTRGIFADASLKRDTEPAILSGFAADAYGFGRNDLQPVAQRLCAGVGQALNWLQSQGLKGRMTGSGSAVFAPILHQIDLQNVPPGLQARQCKSLEVHPLLGWAGSEGLSVGSF
jgi:4-diphosphocytidyl-2-C-methyl-D-erythritol kinase